MKINVPAFAISVGAVFAAAFSVCAFFVAVAPEATSSAIGYLFHINLSGLTQQISWPSYFAGVLAVGVWTAIWAAIAAEFYNLMSR